MKGLLCIVVGLAPLGMAQSQVRPKGPVVAVVDNVQITEDELKLEAQTLQLRRQEYELKVRALENVLSRKVIESAAAAKNLSAEEFLKLEVDSKIPDPSSAEVEGFYWGQKDKFPGPFEKVRDQVTQALMRAKIQDGRQALLQQLRQKAAVQVLIDLPRVTVDVGNAPRRGSPSAPVTIIEFSDYQCPYCRQTEPVLQQLSAKYADRVSLVYKDFPLHNIHPYAQAAAEAARCAGEQGKYWNYHDALFASPVLIPETLLETAQQVQLDVEAFKTCTASGKYKAPVENSALEAQQYGVNSTPSFFINGIPLIGAQPIAAFEKLIDAEIEASGSRTRQ